MHFLSSWPLPIVMVFFRRHGHHLLSWLFSVVAAIHSFFPTMPVHFSARASSTYTGSFELLNKIVRKAFSALIFPVYTADNPLESIHFSARASSMYTGSFELLNKIVRKAFSALIFPVYTADNPLESIEYQYRKTGMRRSALRNRPDARCHPDCLWPGR